MVALPNFTDCLRKRVCCWLKNAKLVITISWFISLIFVVAAFIVACIATNKLTKGGQSATPAAFAAMWTCLILIILSIMGTIIMRKFPSAVSIGFFLGVVFVMSNQMLILFAIFADRARSVGLADGPSVQQAQQAMAVFSFFLFLVYGFFGGVLAIFRNDVVKDESMGDGDGTPYIDNENGQNPLQDAQEEYN